MSVAMVTRSFFFLLLLAASTLAATLQRVLNVSHPIPNSPCLPTPCGPNSNCEITDGTPSCKCLPKYEGTPPSCHPESGPCVLNTDCASQYACINSQCRDPCPGVCGEGARCDVPHHNPVCSCPEGMMGDPFVRCRALPPVATTNPRNERHSRTRDVCLPYPCGPNSKCEDRNGNPICSCLPGYLGAPPSCHIQCVMNLDCGSKNHCVNRQCRDPCSDSCGVGARCNGINHRAVCFCPPGETGDPFIQCSPIPSEATNVSHPISNSPCHPTPCGPNSNCEITEGTPICTCLPKYEGTPPSCHPESGPCVLNTDCASQYACINSQCRDPCPGVCGEGARCDVPHHSPVCTCLEGMMGDPFVQCRALPPVASNPDTLSRERRQYLGQYSGSSSFSGVDGGVPYGGGTYSVGSLGPQGFVGYTGNFGNPFNNFVTPNFDAAAAPAAPQLSTRQITLGPARPPITLPGVLQPGSGQIGQLVTSYQQTLRGALCRALQRLQVSWAETASVCSGIASGNQAGGLLSINTANSRPGGASITISAPPDAQIQPITGPDGNVQGVTVTHQGPDNGGNYVGSFSSSSSSSSNVLVAFLIKNN
ncbi:hypothetical protein B566_EDAN009189 [Ephemera danica]|nr:hypothetical protein B566_EDAN009189 [Ephemera danica]